MNIVLLAIGSIMIFLFNLYIHELGHLVCGFATGYKFHSFQAGFFMWIKEEDRIKFKLLKFFSMGECLMIPHENKEVFKFFWYNFGGSLFNLLSAIAFLLIYKNSEGSILYENLLIVGIIAGIMFFISNSFPTPRGTNDGTNIYAALRSEEAKRGMHAFFYLPPTMAKNGKRFRDLPHEMFKVDEGIKLDNQFIIYLLLCEASRLRDMGEYNLAIEELNRLDFKNLPPSFKILVALEFLDYHIIHRPDFEKAKGIYEDKEVQLFLKNDLPSNTRILATYTYFVLDNVVEGRYLLEKAKKQLINFPDRGYRKMEIEYVERLEKLM
ncbi:site-2 protease family protein [Enterococcus faecium]|uniref:site-2 protease family protein n=2 Tax=Enterococcus TaxID=1350 RepID=UPI000CF24557|nr:site-2 protease family protein [Enterococcus faecium]EME8230765.1 hypothetical protein [Enterococcus faecium]PQF35661.1 hypothetical protein CUS87_03330 [Enterococcus faecium]RBT00840.1 hypothetical protein EA83_00679 [Enterococcus faecium]RBT28538.1 hypothetical protein EA72_00551 [Enterococcus faecium]RBT31817.1 hypothetical protein EB01_01749 [Enterococcus faecium]